MSCEMCIRDSPYVDALSIAQVRALREVRMNQDEMAEEKKAEYMSLILSTVTGVSAGLQLSLIHISYCILVPFASYVLSGEKLTRYNLGAALLCLAGIGLVALDSVCLLYTSPR